MSFETHSAQELVYLTSSLLHAVPHGFSTRRGGVSAAPLDSLNLGVNRGDSPENLQENYRRFCAAIGTDPACTVPSSQVHETTVRLCTAEDAGKGLLRPRDYNADALITAAPGLAITVFSADCGILLLHDPVHNAVGAIHAGWRGCAGGIVEKAVQAMALHFSTDPADLWAAIGPCIGKSCFETDSDVPSAMRQALGPEAEPYLERVGEKWQVDLGGLNAQWLLRAGLSADHIDRCSLCTACHPELFWSHRRMGEARGLQCAMIAPL